MPNARPGRLQVTMSRDARIIRSKTVQMNGFSAEAIERDYPEKTDISFTCNAHVMIFYFDCVHNSKRFLDGREYPLDPGSPGEMDLYPVGTRLTGWVSKNMSRYLLITIRPEKLLETGQLGHVRGCALRPYVGAGDEFSWHLASAIQNECYTGGPLGLIYTETLMTALSLQILRQHSNFSAGLEKPARGGLSSHALRRVVDYLQGSLHQDVSLADAAAICGLSLAHFARSFRLSTGQSPHRWLTLRRIDRAKELLLTDDIALSEIALLCGFAEQSHFTRVFRQITGTSPGAWRRDRKL